MKQFTHPVRVKVRVEAARAAGKWFEETVARNPEVLDKLNPGLVRFLSGLARRTSPTLKLERDFAQRFIDSWRDAFIRGERLDLLIQILQHKHRAPVVGVDAIAELVGDISSALLRPEGRPEKADPLQVLDAVKSAKKSRTKNPYSPTSPYTIELAAEALGVSVNTVKTASKKGKAIMEKVRAAIGDAEPIVVLTADGSCGVAIVKKKEV